MENLIRSIHLGAHINLKEGIIKFDILDNSGHFAQRGHQSPIVIKLDILDCEWHLAITVEYHILDFSSISEPNYLSITSAINFDIIVNVEKFIRFINPFYIYHLNMPDIIRAEQQDEHHLLDYISISKSNYTSATDIKAEQIISDIFAEHHLLDYICINGPNYIYATRAINLNIMVKADRFIRTICPLHINLLIYQDIVIKIEWFIKTIKVELCLPHHGNIIYINYVFMTSSFGIDIIVKKEKFIRIIFISYINLLYNTDIDIKAERFIGTLHSSYLYLVKSINREAPSGDHQLTSKSHRGTSSMNTSEEHIICVQDIMVKQKGLDIQTSCIYLTILSVFISRYFIFNESIIDNYFDIILLALHQWEALDITHPCPSRSGASKSHHIEWRDIFTNIIDSNSFMHHLIKWDEIDHYIVKNISLIYNLHIKVVQDYIVINDIKESQSSYSIIYDTSLYHTSSYDTFGIIMVDGIDLSSMTRDYSIIGFIDFMKHPSEDIDIIFNHNILKKKDLDIRADTSSHIFKFITTTLNTNPTQQFNNTLQSDNIIIDYLTQIAIYSIYHPFSFYNVH